ncbi:MAG: flippase [Deltaproteobacteria bacterium]|nr:flippase [Deltaproteobacteria bacterium]
MFFRLAKNSFSLLIVGLVDKLAFVLLFAVIARKLTQSEFGIYSLALTLIFIGGMITNFGIGNVIIREVAKNRERSKALFNNALLLTLTFSLLTWSFMIGLAFLLNYASEVIFLLSFGGVVFIFMGVGQVSAAILKAYEKMEIFALAGSFHSIISLTFSMLVLWMGGSLVTLVIVLIIAEGFKAAILALIVHRYFTHIIWQFDSAVITLILKQAVPFALLLAYGMLLRRTDMLFMGWLKPIEDVAVYSVAAKFADFLSLFSGSMTGAIFPALSAKLTSSRQESWRLYNDSIGIFAILGFGAAFSLMVLAQPIILFVFGEAYIRGAAPLCWLGWAFLFSVLTGPVGTLLLAAGDQMYHLVALCVVVLGGNALLNFYLIPLYSYNGAAIATFVSVVLGFVGRLILSRAYFGQLPNLVAIVWRAPLAALCMAFVLKALSGLHILILIVIGGLTYGIILAVLGEFRATRYQPIRIKLSKIFGTLT